MGKLHPMELRERVVCAVAGGESCRAVASWFSVAVSSVVKWSQRWRATGSVKPGKMGATAGRCWSRIARSSWSGSSRRRA